MRKLGQIRRNQFEDVCVLLREVYRAPHVELRVFRRPERPGGYSLPGMEGMGLPVALLPDLLRVLAQTLERLVRDGLVDAPSISEAITMETGDPVALRAVARNSRREPRVSLQVPVGCRLVDSTNSWPSKAVIGETKDVSNGGAQVLLSERFPLFSRVEVFMRIADLNFHGRAVVVSADVHPTHGGYRHSLRWLGLTDQAKTALSQATPPS